MNILWLLVFVAVIAFFLLRKRPARGVETPAPLIVPRVSPPQPVEATAAPVSRPQGQAEVPAALLAFKPNRAEDLSPALQKAMFGVFRSVPRPPRLLQQLLSPEFLNTASSSQLSDLITAEPLIAAKLMAAVNSPMYGLQRPASGIDQAVIYLGLNTVRAICLQYILIASFKPEDGARVKRLETAWLASGIASEMTQHLAQELFMEPPGATVSAVVLSFLGRLAIEGTSPLPVLAKIPLGDFLARSKAEQDQVGLSAGEIGRLLMTEWELPPTIINDAAGIDGVLVRPADPSFPDRDARLALAYFCARAGERLADGRSAEFTGLDLLDESPDDFFHFRSYLNHPWLRNLETAAKSPALADKLKRMLEASRP